VEAFGLGELVAGCAEAGIAEEGGAAHAPPGGRVAAAKAD
jgi:hypothetical protein